MRLKVLLGLLLVTGTVGGVVVRAQCQECYDMSGTWLDNYDPEDGLYFTWELNQQGTTVVGTVGDTGYICAEQVWPVSGTVNPDTGVFSITATNPTGDTCESWFTYNGTMSGTSASGTWVNADSTGTFSMTLQTGPPTLSLINSSVTRGTSATFTLNGASNASISGWQFSSSDGHESVTRTSQTNSTTWPGTMVDGGTVSVRVVRNGVPYTPSATIAVIARSNWSQSAPVTSEDDVSDTIPGCFDGTHYLTSPPTKPEDLGGSCANYDDRWQPSPAIDDGANTGFVYVTSVDTTYSVFKFSINDQLADTNSYFYSLQTGTNGRISGVDLLHGTRRHEGGRVNGHYGYWVTAWNDVANNMGIVLEKIVRGPNESNTWETMIADAHNGAIQRISKQSMTEPCAVNMSDDCTTVLGDITFP